MNVILIFVKHSHSEFLSIWGESRVETSGQNVCQFRKFLVSRANGINVVYIIQVRTEYKFPTVRSPGRRNVILAAMGDLTNLLSVKIKDKQLMTAIALR